MDERSDPDVETALVADAELTALALAADPDVETALVADAELTALALAADPDVEPDPDAEPFLLGDTGAELLPEWYMPATFRADAFGSTRRGRAWSVGLIVAGLLIVNGAGLCVTYGFPEIAW